MKDANKINVGLYGGVDNKSKLVAKIIYCDNANECSLYKQGLCARVDGFLASLCPLGITNKVVGYTRRAARYYEFKSKWQSDDKYNVLKRPMEFHVADAGDSVLISLTFAIADYKYYDGREWYEDEVPHVRDCGFSTGRITAIKKEQFTPELVVEICNYRAYAMMGGIISDYKNKIVPNFLNDVRKLFPDIYEKAIAIDEKLKDLVPNYIGRYAKINSLKDGTVLIDCHNNQHIKQGEYLYCKEYHSSLLGFGKVAEVKAVITDDMTYKITDNDMVDENTVFV